MSNTIIIDENGGITVEGDVTPEQEAALAELLGLPSHINCAVPDPRRFVPLPEPGAGERFLQRFQALWHGDVTVGPGVRSVVQFQGCPIRCPGCYVPQTHDFDGGTGVPLTWVLDELTRADVARDGVSIVGGEPFAHAKSLDYLAHHLSSRGQHVVVYTGFTLEYLCRVHPWTTAKILRSVDLLIDGPYRARLGAGAGEWRGSTNQRVIPRPYRHAVDHGLLRP